MASAFGHAVLAIALGQNYPKEIRTWKFWLLGMICTILPDADVISFKLGIPYEAFWGHRGFTHSILFAAIVGALIVIIFHRKKMFSWTGMGLFAFYTLCTASHGLLDAMTSGGLGVAFFSPWDDTRYFLPWRPIQVSPIGVGNFFTDRGIKVILSELIWIGIPTISYILSVKLIKRRAL